MPVITSTFALCRRLFAAVRRSPNVASFSQGNSPLLAALVLTMRSARSRRQIVSSCLVAAAKFEKKVTSTGWLAPWNALIRRAAGRSGDKHLGREHSIRQHDPDWAGQAACPGV